MKSKITLADDLRKELIKLKAICEKGECGRIGYGFCDRCKIRKTIIEIKKEIKN